MEHAERFRIRRFLYPTVFRKPGLDVEWEPSPRSVVDEMIAAAQVQVTDLVYDLGCGDGRIVIAAAAKTGAHGVGIDLDPRRIRESRKNAIGAGVDGVTRFVVEDLFEADITDASVIFLFLFPGVNMRLRPKLLGEVKPGARIVSYCHGMERWKPDDVMRKATNYTYLWVVPANMSGTWEGAVEDGKKRVPIRMTMTQEFQYVSGAVFVGRKVFQVKRARMEGETFTLSNTDDPQNRGFAISLRGEARGDTITGTLRASVLPREESPFVAYRNPVTRTSLAQ
jgi:SAM-dependent methyltransferase